MLRDARLGIATHHRGYVWKLRWVRRALCAAGVFTLAMACKNESTGDHRGPISTNEDANVTQQADGAGEPGQTGHMGTVGDRDANDPTGAGALRAAMVTFDLEGAWAALEALPEQERLQPLKHYLAAHLLLQRAQAGDAERARTELASLERLLPLLADAIAHLRERAELLSGNVPSLVTYQSREDAAELAAIARRAVRAGQAPVALACATRILTIAKRRLADEATARAVRVLTAPEPETAEDARWLYLHARENVVEQLAPHNGPGEDAGALTRARAIEARVGTLSGDAWRERAEHLAERGDMNAAMVALGHAHAPAGACAHAGLMYKSRKHYDEAATAYRECAKTSGNAEHAFLAARALLRADHDAEAIVALEQFQARFPRAAQAREASFLHARTLLLTGKWERAAESFDRHVRDHKRADHKRTEDRDVQRYRALAHLLAKHHRQARGLLEQWSDGGDATERARGNSLAAYAASLDGDHAFALARWRDVIMQQPLSYGAATATAHLQAEHAPLPLPIALGDGRPPEPALDATLPPPAHDLVQLGLLGEAEASLRPRETELTRGSASTRQTEALCEAYGRVGRAERRFELSLQVPSTLLSGAPTARAAWAWNCVYPQPFSELVEAASRNANVDPAFTYGIMRAESAFRVRVLSPVGAVGLMQLMPDTARSVANAEERTQEFLDDTVSALTEPRQNITLGARLLGRLQQRFGHLALAAGAYNAGEEAVARWVNNAKGVPLDVLIELIPYGETRVYIARVWSNLWRYQYLRGGAAALTPFALQVP